jgi:hypothetical protein
LQTERRQDVVQVIGGDSKRITVGEQDGGQVRTMTKAGNGCAGRGAKRVQDVGDVGIASRPRIAVLRSDDVGEIVVAVARVDIVAAFGVAGVADGGVVAASTRIGTFGITGGAAGLLA